MFFYKITEGQESQNVKRTTFGEKHTAIHTVSSSTVSRKGKILSLHVLEVKGMQKTWPVTKVVVFTG